MKSREVVNEIVHHEILKEICILNKIEHDNIIKILAVFISKDFIFSYYHIVLEYFDGKTLSEILFNQEMHNQVEEEPILLSLDDKNYIGKQICEAVKYLHDNRVAHGDIHVSNILVNSELQVKLIDFGLSNFEYLSNSLEHTVDKAYGILNKDIMDKLIGTDIWNTAKLLTEMYSEKRVFMMPSKFTTYVINMENIPLFLKNILIECLDEDYKKRPNIDTILNAYIKELLQ